MEKKHESTNRLLGFQVPWMHHHYSRQCRIQAAGYFFKPGLIRTLSEAQLHRPWTAILRLPRMKPPSCLHLSSVFLWFFRISYSSLVKNMKSTKSSESLTSAPQKNAQPKDVSSYSSTSTPKLPEKAEKMSNGMVETTASESVIKLDSDISHASPAALKAHHRELKPWMPDDSIDISKTSPILDSWSTISSSKKSDAHFDQFEVNKSRFGIETSYDESQYTTVIDRSRPDFKILERKAAKIANEIMSMPSQNIHLAEERGQLDLRDSSEGLDEEARFGSVIRGPNAYVPPSLRSKIEQRSTKSSKDDSTTAIPSPSIEHVPERTKIEASAAIEASETTGKTADGMSTPNNEDVSASELAKPEGATTANESTTPMEEPLKVQTEALLGDDVKEKVLSFKLNPNASEFKPPTFRSHPQNPINYPMQPYPPQYYMPPRGNPYAPGMLTQPYPVYTGPPPQGHPPQMMHQYGPYGAPPFTMQPNYYPQRGHMGPYDSSQASYYHQRHHHQGASYHILKNPPPSAT